MIEKGVKAQLSKRPHKQGSREKLLSGPSIMEERAAAAAKVSVVRGPADVVIAVIIIPQ